MSRSEQITINVDPEAARIYREADEEQRRKLDLLISWRIRGFGSSPDPRQRLKQIMQEMGEEAESRGLTPEILESILNEG